MLTVFLYCLFGALIQQSDTLDAAVVHASFKGDTVNIQTVSSIGMDRARVSSAKDVTAIIPNFYQPDYGSHTTSSIYIRGFGSRMDQPAAGMYIDGIPIMNKSLYDFEFDGIRNVSLLRGPQGTLYGRNTSSGVMLVRTMSAAEMAGMRASLEYSPASAFKGSISGGGKMGRKILWGVSAFGRYYDGDFRFPDGTKADWSSSWGVRFRLEWNPSSRLHFENILSVGYVNEGGYAYRQFDESTSELLPLSYNDPSGYKRISIIDGLKAEWTASRTRWSANVSWQFLDDDMILDNDFTDESLFTMGQKQKEHSVTAELMVKRKNERSCWQPLTGAFLFGKFLSMQAPVLFKRDGIERLILDNANRGIRSVLPDAYLDIREDEFVIGNDFCIPAYGAALFHNSVWKVGNWAFEAGVRLESEYASMDYDSYASINYLFSMSRKGWTPVSSRFKGTETQSFFEVLPSFGVTRSFRNGSVYASVKKGYKAGGFNTQMFSDILQNIMMNDMMSGMRAQSSADGDASSADAVCYRPESAWNFEVGTKWNVGPFAFEAGIFDIECRDQQITVMPEGTRTGRRMSNAGQSRSYGAEAAASFSAGEFSAAARYGCAIAEFISYRYSDTVDYSGKYVPYAPQNTFSFDASWSHPISRGLVERIDLAVNVKGVGKIYWNEENTLSEPFYALAGFNATARFRKLAVSLWGTNIFNARYNTFYFKSVGRSFFSQGRPARFGITLRFDII